MSQEQQPSEAAFAAALQLLQRRDYARAALLQKLEKKGHSAHDAEQAVVRAESLGYVDDARYARAVARTRVEASRWGKRRVAQDLARRGVPEELAAHALTQLEEDMRSQVSADPDDLPRTRSPWADAATTALRKKYGEWVSLEPKDKQRRLAFLLRRGFGWDEALSALEATRAESEP